MRGHKSKLGIAGALLFAVAMSPERSASAADKSGMRDGLIKLPSAAGTITAEGSTFFFQPNTGAAHYSVPLPELPSRAGVAPHLALSYNQMSGDAASGFGSGWRIDVPSIEISTEFGVPYTTTFAAGDNMFRFRGQRLYADPTAQNVYRLQASEDEILVRYHAAAYTVPWASAVDGSTPSIASGFDVTYPDGRVELYSGDLAIAEGSGTLVTRFPLVYEVSRQGESVAYKYRKEGGNSYLSEVAFASGLSRYTFDLAPSASNVHSYQFGYRQSSGLLVQQIFASYAGKTRDRWCLAYTGPTAPAGGVFTAPACAAAAAGYTPQIVEDVPVHDRLATILRFGNTEPLTPSSPHEARLDFEYSSLSAPEFANRPLVYSTPAAALSGADLSKLELLDVNDDGLPDIVEAIPNEPTQVYYGDADPTRAYSTHSPLVLTRPGRQVALDLQSDAFQVADIDGDGYEDILEFEGTQVHVYACNHENPRNMQHYVWRTTIDSPVNVASFGVGALFVDLNQDGLSDLLVNSRDSNTGALQWTLYLNTTYIDSSGTWNVAFQTLNYALPYPFNMSSVLNDPKSYDIIDINGDGLPDFEWTNAAQGFMCVYENTGAFFQQPQSATLLFGRSDLNDPLCVHGVKVNLQIPLAARNFDTWMLDANGDGLLDIVTTGNSVYELYVWYGRGDLLFTDPVVLKLNDAVRPVDPPHSRIADIDGDGQDEIILFQTALTPGDKIVIVDFNRLAQDGLVKAGLLTAVESESGERYDIRYATSIDEMTRDLHRGLTPTFAQFPVVVAKEVARSIGKRGASRDKVDVTEYQYHDPYYDPITHEFRGFATVGTLKYGDEGLPFFTQETAYQEDAFATFDQNDTSLVRRFLSGRLLGSKTYAISPDATLLAQIAATNSFDPHTVTLHSLSSYAQQQPLVQPARLLREAQKAWTMVEQVSNGGTYFARYDGEAALEHGTTDTTASALKTTKTVIVRDGHNVVSSEHETTSWSNVPLGVAMPSVDRLKENDYVDARTALAQYGAVSLPSEVKTTVNGILVDKVHTDYSSTNGLPSATHRTIFATPPADAVLVQVAGTDATLLARLRALAVAEREERVALVYDSFGNVVVRGDVLGDIETTKYDASGVFPVERHEVNLADRTLDQVTTLGYRADGRLTSSTSPLGLASTFAYDDLGQLTSRTDSDGGNETYQTRLALDGAPQLKLTSVRRYAAGTGPQGDVEIVDTLAAYAPDGSKLAELENVAGGGVRARTFHGWNRTQKPAFEWRSYLTTTGTVHDVYNAGLVPAPAALNSPDRLDRFDPFGHISSTTLSTGKVIVISRDPWGTATTEKYPVAGGIESRETDDVRSTLGLLARREGGKTSAGVDAPTTLTQFDRDAMGTPASVALDGEPTARTLRYDSSHKVEYQRIPGAGEIYSLHDSRGRLAAQIRVSNDHQQASTTELGYDSLDRLTQRWENGRLVREQVYDQYPTPFAPAGELQPHVAKPMGELAVLRVFDPNNLYDYEEHRGYDARGSIVSRSIQIGQRAFVENYANSFDGHRIATVNPRGLREDVALDEANQIRNLSITPAGGSVEPVAEQVTYGADGITSIAYRQGAKSVFGYASASRALQKIDATYHASQGGADQLVQSEVYNLDGDDKVISISDGVGQTSFGAVDRSAAFQYDVRGELTKAARYQRTLNYGYDKAGNFTANDELAGTWRSGAETHLVPLGTDANAFDFDAFGRMQQSPEIASAKYDLGDRLLHVQTKTGEGVDYGYAPDGRLYYRHASGASAAESLYPTPSYAEEPTGSQSFAFIGNRRIVRFDHGMNASADRWFYYLQDAFGSNELLLTANGAPVEQMLYLPYASEVSAPQISSAWRSYLAANTNLVPATEARNRYKDDYLDATTGLYLRNARPYHPALGRFVTPDPNVLARPELCEASTLACTLYIYSANDPYRAP